jgi:hypothetical protein
MRLMAASTSPIAHAKRRPRWWWLCALVVTGCGPVLATREVATATVALEAARAARAETLAIYEFTAAEITLTKAREEEGYSDFQAAVDLARRATVLAEEARRRALATPVTLTPAVVPAPVPMAPPPAPAPVAPAVVLPPAPVAPAVVLPPAPATVAPAVVLPPAPATVAPEGAR